MWISTAISRPVIFLQAHVASKAQSMSNMNVNVLWSVKCAPHLKNGNHLIRPDHIVITQIGPTENTSWMSFICFFLLFKYAATESAWWALWPQHSGQGEPYGWKQARNSSPASCQRSVKFLMNEKQGNHIFVNRFKCFPFLVFRTKDQVPSWVPSDPRFAEKHWRVKIALTEMRFPFRAGII